MIGYCDANESQHHVTQLHKLLFTLLASCVIGGVQTAVVVVNFSGFPLDKAVEYARVRNPLLINDLNMQYFIQDRYSWNTQTDTPLLQFSLTLHNSWINFQC